MRARSVSRLISGTPQARAKRVAPSPASITWSLFSITILASRATFLMLRTLATAPARRVGPCITLASSSTMPSSFGSPPKPTEVSFGSSSTIVTPCTTASSVSPPALITSKAFLQAAVPFALEMTISFGPPPIVWAASGRAALESSQSRLRIVFRDSLASSATLRTEFRSRIRPSRAPTPPILVRPAGGAQPRRCWPARCRSKGA